MNLVRRCESVSKLSIYMKRIMAIEDTGRRDWHEPLRRLRFNS
jgi:hypothetical protein